MGKTSDILKELEDIGAVGGKVQEATIRRLAPVPAFPLFDETVSLPLPTASLVPPSALLAGFGEQLASLETALQGMLDWCANARGLAQEYEQAETDAEAATAGGVAADVTAAEAAPNAEEEVESSTEVVADEDPPAPMNPVKPKFTKEALKRLFLDPTYQPEELKTAQSPTAETSHE